MSKLCIFKNHFTYLETVTRIYLLLTNHRKECYNAPQTSPVGWEEDEIWAVDSQQNHKKGEQDHKKGELLLLLLPSDARF